MLVHTLNLASWQALQVGWSTADSAANRPRRHLRTRRSLHHTPSGFLLFLAQSLLPDPESWLGVYTHICPGIEKNNNTNVCVSKKKMISVACNFSSKFYLPLSKVAVFWPVGDPTDKQCVGIVPWTGSEVSWTVGKWNVHPRNTMVHWGKHGKVLIREELDEA